MGLGSDAKGAAKPRETTVASVVAMGVLTIGVIVAILTSSVTKPNLICADGQSSQSAQSSSQAFQHTVSRSSKLLSAGGSRKGGTRVSQKRQIQHKEASAQSETKQSDGGRRNAYATVLYEGTRHDYEFFVAGRVMLQSAKRTGTNADLLAIVTDTFPPQWIQTLNEDGVRVVKFPSVMNPYAGQAASSPRFKHALNKLLAWNITEYNRIVLLDADNLILENIDELFQCGNFCAVFINPCIFHTGLMVLEPSKAVFADMIRKLPILESFDGADQGFLVSYFPDLLESPLFVPPAEQGKYLEGMWRLPMGYQMDSGYFYLTYRWNVPCSANKVLTYPSAPMFKPWKWWSWPILPVGLFWHEQRRQMIGYEDQHKSALFVAFLWILLFASSFTGIGRFVSSSLESLKKFCWSLYGSACSSGKDVQNGGHFGGALSRCIPVSVSSFARRVFAGSGRYIPLPMSSDHDGGQDSRNKNLVGDSSANLGAAGGSPAAFGSSAVSPGQERVHQDHRQPLDLELSPVARSVGDAKLSAGSGSSYCIRVSFGGLVLLAGLAIALSFPFLVVPNTIHPCIGWALYIEGCFVLLHCLSAYFALPGRFFAPLCVIIVGLTISALPWYRSVVDKVVAVNLWFFVLGVSVLPMLSFIFTDPTLNGVADRPAAGSKGMQQSLGTPGAVKSK